MIAKLQGEVERLTILNLDATREASAQSIRAVAAEQERDQLQAQCDSWKDAAETAARHEIIAIGKLTQERDTLRDHLKLSTEQRERLIDRAQLTADMLKSKSEHIMSLIAKADDIKKKQTNWHNEYQSMKSERDQLRERVRELESLNSVGAAVERLDKELYRDRLDRMVAACYSGLLARGDQGKLIASIVDGAAAAIAAIDAHCAKKEE